MPDSETLFNAFVTIPTTIDPPGLAPLFLALTRAMTSAERRQVSGRGSVIAFGILAVFGVVGAGILGGLGITLPAFRVAGGLLLFFIAFEMVFEKRQERKERSADVLLTRDDIRDVAAFPLALPLIAGPGAISATVLISGSLPGAAGKAALIGFLALCIAISFAVLLRVNRFLGRTGPLDPDAAAGRPARRARRAVRGGWREGACRGLRQAAVRRRLPNITVCMTRPGSNVTRPVTTRAKA